MEEQSCPQGVEAGAHHRHSEQEIQLVPSGFGSSQRTAVIAAVEVEQLRRLQCRLP